VDVLGGLSQGLAVALTPAHLGFALLGAVIGTAVGVLPGLGTPTTIAMLLPPTYALDPTAAIILMSGIFCGAMYGGSTTSILLNVPGESASIVTCFDGHQLARQGRAGEALGMSALASFIAASLSVLALSGVAPALSAFALRFGPAERAALVMLGLALVVSLSAGSLAKGLLTAALGLVLGTVGLDPASGMPRFTLGIPRLLDGSIWCPSPWASSASRRCWPTWSHAPQPAGPGPLWAGSSRHGTTGTGVSAPFCGARVSGS
jgi:putative tricarboxylic transport membrane protein